MTDFPEVERVSAQQLKTIFKQAHQEQWISLAVVGPKVDVKVDRIFRRDLWKSFPRVFQLETQASGWVEACFVLTKLKSLVLKGHNLEPNQVRNLAKNLSSLIVLDLSQNELSQLPAEIGQLTQLQSLYLRSNQLSKLPAEIGQLTQLQSLDLRSNELRQLPTEIGQLTQLQWLFLSSNQLSQLPVEIGQLTQLRRLYLSSNELSQFPVEICQLTQLQLLFLRSNELSQLPVEIGQLTQLQSLDLGSNQLSQLPAEIGQFTQLQILDLEFNQLSQLPSEIGQLTQLHQLHLDSNQFRQLPAEIGQLTQLKQLSLGSNQLSQLPAGIGQLIQLRWLDLDSNELSQLPVEMGNLVNLKEIELSDNPLTFPGHAVLEGGTENILAFLREHLEGSRPLWESKIIVVGEAGVGKTSLIRQLLGQAFQEGEETTPGLEIYLYPLEHPSEADTTMDLRIWDFGGQQILHATHQFFLTDRSLFVLVWNARIGYEQSKLEYWLDTIHARDAEAPVLIVAAHAETWDATFQYLKLRQAYPQIKATFVISNKERETTQEDFQRLVDTITRESANLPLMGRTCPKSWLDTMEQIQADPEAHTTPLRLRKMAEQHGVREFDAFADFLHALGYILYFQDNHELCDHVILKPDWLAQNISKVLAKDGVQEGKALLTKAMADRLWADVDEPVRKLFLNMMDVFDLSYKIEDAEEISLVVEKLREDPANYGDLWHAKAGQREVGLIYELTSALPPGIPTWFIARSHRFTTRTHWRYGTLLADNDARTHLALVQAHNHDRYLEIRVRGPEPANFFALIRDGVRLTLDRYQDLPFTEKVPCPCEPGCQHKFQLSTLERRHKKGSTHVTCDNSDKDLEILKLLYGFELPDLAKRLHELGKKTEAGFQSLEAKSREMTEFVQRELLKLFSLHQNKEDTRFPKLGLFWKKEDGMARKMNRLGGQRICLHLACEAPGCWHLVEEGGYFEFEVAPEWQRHIQPAFDRLVKTLNMAGPILTSGSKVADLDVADSLKFMSDLAKPLEDESRETKHDSERQLIRRIIIEQDLHGENWGLERVFTKEGYVWWVCPKHKEQLDNGQRFERLT